MLQERIRLEASVSLESRKLPDPYPFFISDSKIISPITGRPAEESISRGSMLDEIEYQAFQDIQSWATTHKHGLAFWISPPESARSSQGKIIISELEKSRLFNRSVLFDCQDGDCKNIANKIQREFNGNGVAYLDDNELRRNPIFVNRSVAVQEWLRILSKIIPEELQWQMIASGEDLVELERTLEWAKGYAQGVRSEEDFIGNNPLSCPPSSAFKVMSGERECVFCPICKKLVTVVVLANKIQCKECKNFGPAM